MIIKDPISQIFARYLIELGVATLPSQQSAWPIYYSNEPSSPDEIMTVYNTQGQDNGRIMPSGELMQFYGIQIKIRSYTESNGWQQAELVRQTLAYVPRNQPDYLTVITVGLNNYCVGVPTGIGQVIPLGKDTSSSKRSIFTLNCMTSISPAVSLT